MKTRLSLFLTLTLLLTAGHVCAQQKDRLTENKQFAGAMSKKKTYRAIYQMDQASPEIIKKTIRNINNLLKDPRLKGHIQVELIAFSGGTEAYKKSNEYEAGIRGLVEQGVIVAQCLNSLAERKIEKSELFDFIGYVPSGNGELVIRANEGWTIIKP